MNCLTALFPKPWAADCAAAAELIQSDEYSLWNHPTSSSVSGEEKGIL